MFDIRCLISDHEEEEDEENEEDEEDDEEEEEEEEEEKEHVSEKKEEQEEEGVTSTHTLHPDDGRIKSFFDFFVFSQGTFSFSFFLCFFPSSSSAYLPTNIIHPSSITYPQNE